jgi:hypothetical protein
MASLKGEKSFHLFVDPDVAKKASRMNSDKPVIKASGRTFWQTGALVLLRYSGAPVSWG